MRLGDFVRCRRKELGLSQFALAEKADLTTNFISLLERNEQVPSITSLARIAEGLQVQVGDMLECILPGMNDPILVHSDRVEYVFGKERDKEDKVAEQKEGPQYYIHFAGIDSP